jgi:hypothetical protein
MKGFSFGSSPRNSLMPINIVSPAAKYNIKGLVEINLSKKSGPSMKNGREDSVDKTTLSYIPNNSNVISASFSLDPQATKQKLGARPQLCVLESKTTKICQLNFSTKRPSTKTLALEHTNQKW